MWSGHVELLQFVFAQEGSYNSKRLIFVSIVFVPTQSTNETATEATSTETPFVDNEVTELHEHNRATSRAS